MEDIQGAEQAHKLYCISAKNGPLKYADHIQLVCAMDLSINGVVNEYDL